MKELGKEVVPFLVSRQFRGLKASFGVKNSTDENSIEVVELLSQVLGELKINDEMGHGNVQFEDDMGDTDVGGDADHPFMVSAHVLSREASKLVLRACSTPAYIYACREVVSQAITVSKVIDEKLAKEKKRDIGILYLPEGTSVDTKFNSITLPETIVGEKVQVKSSTIGRGVKIGKNCRLNNVVVHDNVTIGENCVLQNSVLSAGCSVGNNCNLNDCQVGSKSEVATGTKAKGEGF